MARRRQGHGAAHAPTPAVATWRGGMAVRAVVIVMAGLLAYWPAFDSPFLFDDQPAIVENGQIRSLDSLTAALSPPRDTPVAGRPLVNLSFAFNYAFNGLNPRGYRVTNLAIHLLAGLVLFGLLRRLLLLPGLANRFGGHATNLGFGIALLWVLHPLQSEVVNYVVERSESLMGLWYFITVSCGVRALSSRGWRWTAGAVTACAAGMLCKESMVTAPVAVALIDRALVFDSWRAALAARRRLYAGLAATWGILAALLLTAPRSSIGFDAGTTAWVYLLNQARMVARYLGLTFWPRALVLDYGLPQPLVLGDVLLPGLLVVALLATALAAFIYKPGLGLPGLLVFLTLAPTSSFVPIATEVGAERRMYLPLAPMIAMLVLGLFLLVYRRRTAADAGGDGGRRLAVGGLVFVLSSLMIAGVHLRNREYASPLSMAQTIVDRWPNGRGHFLLGTMLIEAGRDAEGMVELRTSARDYPGALFAIGTELLGAGQLDEGIDVLQQFIRALPMHSTVFVAREMLGRAYAGQGNLPAAREQLELLVRLAPTYAVGHDLLGRVLAGQGEFQAAIAEFQRVLVIAPDNLEAARNLEAVQRLAAGSNR